MADVLTGESYVSREPRPERDRLTHRVLVVAVALLSVILAGELVYHLVLAPRLVIERIEIEGDVPMSTQEILSLAGVAEGTPYFSVDSEVVAARIESHPVVREAHVTTVFPNELMISASRRVPLAAALAETGDGSVPLVFDEEGVVFQLGLRESETELPVVSGLRFETVDLGLKLPQFLVDFLTQLRAIKMNRPELYRLFSEYRVVRKNEYAFEVVLYPMHYRLPVRIGTSIDADMIQYVMMMLDVLQKEGRISSLAELDFRSGEGVLRPRAANEATDASGAGTAAEGGRREIRTGGGDG
jgi:cell division protein FtsQ